MAANSNDAVQMASKTNYRVIPSHLTPQQVRLQIKAEHATEKQQSTNQQKKGTLITLTIITLAVILSAGLIAGFRRVPLAKHTPVPISQEFSIEIYELDKNLIERIFKQVNKEENINESFDHFPHDYSKIIQDVKRTHELFDHHVSEFPTPHDFPILDPSLPIREQIKRIVEQRNKEMNIIE